MGEYQDIILLGEAMAAMENIGYRATTYTNLKTFKT